MSLDFDVSAINNHSDQNGKLDPVVEAVIWHQMSTFTGGSITEKNYKLVFERISILERVFGSMMKDSVTRHDVNITLADVKRCIGLTTNCYEEGKVKFKNHIMRSLLQDAEREAGSQERKANETTSVMKESISV